MPPGWGLSIKCRDTLRELGRLCPSHRLARPLSIFKLRVGGKIRVCQRTTHAPSSLSEAQSQDSKMVSDKWEIDRKESIEFRQDIVYNLHKLYVFAGRRSQMQATSQNIPFGQFAKIHRRRNSLPGVSIARI